MNNEILYLVASLRDGSIDIRNCKNYEIKIGQKEVKWLSEVLKPIIENNYNVKVNINNNLLRLTNKKAVGKIQKLTGIKTGGWITPPFLRKLKPDELIPYIRGFWDSEGGIPKEPEKCIRAEQSYISFHQKEKEPLEFIRNTMIELGYKPTKITFCSSAHEFRITRKKQIIKFCNEIGSWHPEKKQRMQRMVKQLS